MTQAPAILPKRPASADDLASLIAHAHSENSQIQLTGSASLPLTHYDPSRPLQPVSTLRLNKVLEHAVADMTVIAHAGITLEALQRQLAWQNQWLPIDPPALSGRGPGQRTLGGLIATNSLGPLRFGCGDFRLLILGMKWIDGSGTLIKAGGRTVKNVAGYASHRLMIGACGTLGALAEVTLRTFARPVDERCALFFCDTAARAESLIAQVFTAPVSPAYIQIIGREGFKKNPLQLPTSRMIVVVGFLDRPDICASQIDLVRALPEARALESISQTAAQAGRLRLWMTSEPSTTEPAPPHGSIAFRLHALSSQSASLIEALEALAQKIGGTIWLVSEAGSGIIRGTNSTPNLHIFLRELQSLSAAHQSSLLITHSTFPLPAPRPDDFFRRLKSQLDPQNTLGLPTTSLTSL